MVRPGDIVLTQGAGNITNVAHALSDLKFDLQKMKEFR
jgi:UDP-N-acetylmuramate-alanine ligase